jgi:hypothetical protein
VPWISAAIPLKERRRASREDAVTILSLIFAPSGDLTVSRRHRNVGERMEKTKKKSKERDGFWKAKNKNK